MNSGNLKYQFARINIAEKLIVINVAIFILYGLFTFLFQVNGNAVLRWFELPQDFMDFIQQPWSIVTYSFFHADLWHLFFNMLMLYYTGRIFLNLFGPRRFLNVYFMGVILGGLFFQLAYNVFPVFLSSQGALIGASAGVMAVLIFICTYIPNQEVRVFFFNLKLWYIGAFLVLLDLIWITTGDNPGGRFAHLGGSLLGYLYARQLMAGKDIGAGFEKLMDGIANLFKKREKKPPLKTVYRNTARKSNSQADYDKQAHQRKIDTILDKISKSGYESLSKEEKDFLFKAGKED